MQEINRRRLIGLMGAAAVQGVSHPGGGDAAAAGPDKAPRMLLDRFVKDKSKVDAFKRGVAAMKARKPSDPRSWFFQAAIHGVSDEFIADARKQDPGIARADRKFWNQCTHFNNASSAEFLIWHRAYVYYFERILREASGDKDFSLPYWNYAEPSQRACPGIFADPDRDPTSRHPRNPLYDGRREPKFMTGALTLTDRAVSVAQSAEKTAFFARLAGNAFAGATDDQELDAKGALEAQPHDQIHIAVGGIMADPETAAFDPIFWVHHCNVDRLWSLWDCLPGRIWGVTPERSWFDAKPWWFVDADGSIKNLPRSSYFSARALGVRFDNEAENCTPLSATPLSGSEPSSGPVLLTAMRESPVVGEGNGVQLSATSAQTVSVPIAAAVGDRSGRELLADRSPRRRVLLKITGVDYEVAPSVGFDVYVNLPQGEPAGRSSPSYVGTLKLFGIKHRQHRRAGDSGQLFDITEIARRSGANIDAIRIDVVPFDLLEGRGGEAPLQRSGNTVIGKFQVLVVDDPERR